MYIPFDFNRMIFKSIIYCTQRSFALQQRRFINSSAKFRVFYCCCCLVLPCVLWFIWYPIWKWKQRNKLIIRSVAIYKSLTDNVYQMQTANWLNGDGCNCWNHLPFVLYKNLFFHWRCEKKKTRAHIKFTDII